MIKSKSRLISKSLFIYRLIQYRNIRIILLFAIPTLTREAIESIVSRFQNYSIPMDVQ